MTLFPAPPPRLCCDCKHARPALDYRRPTEQWHHATCHAPQYAQESFVHPRLLERAYCVIVNTDGRCAAWEAKPAPVEQEVLA